MAHEALSPFPEAALALPATHRQKRLYFACKRCMDIALSAPFLIITLPLLLLIALLIKLDSAGPVLFKQERVGMRKRSIDGEDVWELGTFMMYKFRTMYHNCNPSAHRQFVKALIRNHADEVERLRHNGATVVNKLGNDERITRTGTILRRISLDELPQLLNVLRGEMSLVGPRPPLPYEVEEYGPHHWERLGTIPGCVGLWQVSGWLTLGFEDMVALDVWYVQHQSLWLDVKILLKTVPAILSGNGGG